MPVSHVTSLRITHVSILEAANYCIPLMSTAYHHLKKKLHSYTTGTTPLSSEYQQRTASLRFAKIAIQASDSAYQYSHQSPAGAAAASAPIATVNFWCDCFHLFSHHSGLLYWNSNFTGQRQAYDGDTAGTNAPCEVAAEDLEAVYPGALPPVLFLERVREPRASETEPR